MQKIILFFCCASIALTSFCQLNDSTFQYKGGENLLQKMLIKNLHFNRITENDSSKINRFFFISFTVNNVGEINKVNIISLGKMLDSEETKNVFFALKKTNSNWINHTKKDQIVVLPIYCIQTHERPEKPANIINQMYYSNWKKVELIYLNAITVFVYPTIYDHSIKGL
jgi:hypothetical protein